MLRQKQMAYGLLLLWPRRTCCVPTEVHLEGSCFNDPALSQTCCNEEAGPFGDPSCWNVAVGAKDPDDYPSLFARCCLRAGFERDRAAVLVPDAFLDLLMPRSVVSARRARLLPLRPVTTGLVSAAPGGPWMLARNATVIIEIGAHTWMEQELVQALLRPEVILLAFEPDRTSFQRLQRWRSTLLKAQVGRKAIQRLHLIPCAVGPLPDDESTRFAELRRSPYLEGSCNSLLPPNPEARSYVVSMGCGTATNRSETVFVVTLREILARLDGVDNIDLVKIDAQGLDLAIVHSGGDLVPKRVRRLRLEVQDVPDGDAQLGYKGMHTKASAITALRALGFILDQCTPITPEIREEDCEFVKQV